MFLGINAGFSLSTAELPSSLTVRQDRETLSTHKSCTLLAEVKARKSAVFKDKNRKRFELAATRGDSPEHLKPGLIPSAVPEGKQKQISVFVFVT